MQLYSNLNALYTHSERVGLSLKLSNPLVKFKDFPKAIGFIISHEFCERFNYYGVRAILALYLSFQLGYDESSAIFIFHTFATLVYLFPLLGSILADGYLGRYRTILYLSLIYAFGGIFLTTGAIPNYGVPGKLFTWIGLFFVALGTGGTKPCVSAFGADQFKIPEQMEALTEYFKYFYAAIYSGSLISALTIPIFREDVECFGNENCYTLAFGIPTFFMIAAVVSVVAGHNLYVKVSSTGRFTKALKCIFFAFYKKVKNGRVTPKDHWLDYSEPYFGKNLVTELKVLFRILVMFIPMPMFWALSEQQASRWTFQATRTDPRVAGIHFKPEHLQILNPLLTIAFIPLFKFAVYPLMKACDVTRPLQKMGIGLLLMMCSFVVGGIIENTQYEQKLGPINPGPREANIILFNGYPCDFSYQISENEDISIRKYSKYSFILRDKTIPRFEWTPIKPAQNCQTIMFSAKDIERGKINTYLVRPSEELQEGDPVENRTVVERFEMHFHRPKSLRPDISVILASQAAVKRLILKRKDHRMVVNFEDSGRVVANRELPDSGKFKVYANNDESLLGDWSFEFAQNSLLIVGVDKNNETDIRQIVIVKPFTMSIAVMVPQFVLATAGEIMFSITGLEFSYSQSPRGMKSLLQAFWLLMVAIGNLIVVLITSSRFFDNMANESFLFAFLMLIDILVFIVLARMYQPIGFNVGDSDSSDLEYFGGKSRKPKLPQRRESHELEDLEMKL